MVLAAVVAVVAVMVMAARRRPAGSRWLRAALGGGRGVPRLGVAAEGAVSLGPAAADPGCGADRRRGFQFASASKTVPTRRDPGRSRHWSTATWDPPGSEGVVRRRWRASHRHSVGPRGPRPRTATSVSLAQPGKVWSSGQSPASVGQWRASRRATSASGDLVEVVVVAADGAEVFGRHAGGRATSSAVKRPSARTAGVAPTGTASTTRRWRTGPQGDGDRGTRSGARGEAVVDDQSATRPREVQRRAADTEEAVAAAQLGRFRERMDRGHLVRYRDRIAWGVHEDLDAAGADGAEGDLGCPRHAELAHDQGVERESRSRVGDLGGDGHAAADQVRGR